MIVSLFICTKHRNVTDVRTDGQADLTLLLQRSSLRPMRIRCKILIITSTMTGSGSTGASLNEPLLPNYNNWPSIFWRAFLVVTLQNNNSHTSARAQKIFRIRKMRPLSIRDPQPGGSTRGVLAPALGSGTHKLIRRREDWIPER